MLEVHGLTRRFGDRVAVDDVSFTVPTGTTVGFVGANGAGKTTTMRMIMGLLAPTAGEVLWNGRPATDADRRGFGYMPEERGLYPKQPILTQLVYLGELRGMPAADARSEATELLTALGLGERTKDKLEKLSLGNQQRVQIAASLMADPSMLVLDEPFSGLDPIAVDAMSAMLQQRTASGIPVLFSSHQLDLVDRLCDALVILSQGRVVAAGTREELIAMGTTRHRMVLDSDAGWLRDMRGITVDDVHGNAATFTLDAAGVENDLLAEAIRRGKVLEFAPLRPTLSEIYRKVTGQ
ncbi:ATP-binding cassette domain-containing protein [Aestuariimicrobium sp. p3-SID1156]|uniref:ABC transporter ATP-binding protein n=1 Tax=Aestuariimicrobium sp. p3-SID1156 TaxID=2916038 RepID=UPI00223B8D7F|nr:ATP-binding cassette domain-containing protein [Aestuariimicrobium sp. p3-SID1156]MCT1459310.1 ATP-binding cassette domain-containing protein [Aestuariimicrobium sp. p3-SID1156]